MTDPKKTDPETPAPIGPGVSMVDAVSRYLSPKAGWVLAPMVRRRPPSFTAAPARGRSRLLQDGNFVGLPHFADNYEYELLLPPGVAEQFKKLKQRLEKEAADSLETDEHTDSVIDVDDEIADLEIAEIGEERARRRAAPFVDLSFFLENVRLGPELESGIRKAKSAGQMSDAHEDGGSSHLLGTLDRRGVDLIVAEHFDRSFRAARGVGNKHHRLAEFAAAPDLGHPVGDAAGELQCWLTGNVIRLINRQGLERRRAFQPRRHLVPGDNKF